MRLISLVPPSYQAGEWRGQTRIIIVFIQISGRVTTFFFHLMSWGISRAFIYGFIVKPACFVPQRSNSFLEQSLTYSGLPKFPTFPSLSVAPYWDFYNYLYNYPILSLSKEHDGKGKIPSELGEPKAMESSGLGSHSEGRERGLIKEYSPSPE